MSTSRTQGIRHLIQEQGYPELTLERLQEIMSTISISTTPSPEYTIYTNNPQDVRDFNATLRKHVQKEPIVTNIIER